MCTDPEADVLIKQIRWEHVDVVEEHLQKYRKYVYSFNEDRKRKLSITSL